MSTITVRLEYGGMRFENDVQPGQVVSKIKWMADNHCIDVGDINPYELHAAQGKCRLTGHPATFKVIQQERSARTIER